MVRYYYQAFLPAMSNNLFGEKNVYKNEEEK